MNHLKIIRQHMSQLRIELQRATTAELRARKAVNALAKDYVTAVRQYRQALEQAARVAQHSRTPLRRTPVAPALGIRRFHRRIINSGFVV